MQARELVVTVSPHFSIPEKYTQYLQNRLVQLGYDLHKPETLSQVIRELSQKFLLRQLSLDYWADSKYRAAYLSYFQVLNYLRARAVLSEASRQNFLVSAKKISDWGCGLGAASWAILDHEAESLNLVDAVDSSDSALGELKKFFEFLNVNVEISKKNLGQIRECQSDTLILSYVLNEVASWPEIPDHVQRLIIIEPSTHQASRALLKWREEILTRGWYAWAPCVHQGPCPVYTQSPRDWCHHRINWNKPEWFVELEKHLPMRNDTLTMSYLLIARQPPPERHRFLARVIGDEQEERGKSRQQICRGERREFLSWLHRDQVSPYLERGDLIKLRDFEEKKNEVRISSTSGFDLIDD
ncbi:MAG: hypothetical protein IT289_00610 [Oligoflexia bacterium]|nr:hypothetical protein [Oligoflexia bacterium]